MPNFSNKSFGRLRTCDQRLKDVFMEVIEIIDCKVLDGHRNEERQNIAFNEGYSKVQYPNSRHNSLPSMAVDVVPYPVDWSNINRFHELAGVVKTIAHQKGIKIKWGGEFSFFDGPHWEIDE